MLAFEHAKQDGQARIQQAFDGLLSGFFLLHKSRSESLKKSEKP